MKPLLQAINDIESFTQGSLRNRVAELERSFSDLDKTLSADRISELQIGTDLLNSALVVKQMAGQINEIVHSIGILLLLPHVLDDSETIQDLSLAAGNTGRPFDLETNQRIAEFKFIHWRGNADTIRENALFKDFYFLAEYDTDKQRFLYVIDDKFPLKFLNGGRSLPSVMSRNANLLRRFSDQYGDRFSTVREYFQFRRDKVQIVDVSRLIPEFANVTSIDVSASES